MLCCGALLAPGLCSPARSQPALPDPWAACSQAASVAERDGGIPSGLLLAIGRVPRAASLALAASLVPTTLAGHRFWEATNDEEKKTQLIHFLKNAGILGGLLMSALDTGGRPSVFWSSRRWISRTGRSIGSAAQSAGHTVADAVPGHG